MQNHKRKNEYSDQEKEWRFARWFWNHPDISSWDTTKIFVTFLIALVIAITGYIIISSIYTAPTAAIIGIGLLIGISILINTEIRSTFSRLLRRDNYNQIKIIESYKGINYYFLNEHEEVLFIENGRDLTAIGLFKLKAIPLVIQGNFERFIRSLYQQQIPLYWLYGQAPVEEGAILESPAISDEARKFYGDKSLYDVESHMESKGGMWAVRIIFGTRQTIPAGGNIETKRFMLYKKLNSDLLKISTAFTSAYPHTILEPLSNKELEKAFSIMITGGGIPAFF